MLRLYHWATIGLLALLLFPSLAVAQNEDSLGPGDGVIIIAPALDVRVQPDVDSGVAAEVLGGMVSRIVAVEDDGEIMWIYLADNAYGWVQAAVDGEPTLAAYSADLLEQMVAEATAAIEADPNNVEAYVARGSAYLGQRNYELAIADYSRAIELSPQDGRLYDYRGKAYLDNHNDEQAMNDFEQAITLGHNPANTHNRLGIAKENYYGNGAGMADFSVAIETAPGYGLLYNNLAISLGHLGLSNDAFVNYAQAIQRDPHLGIAYANRANHRGDLGDYTAAINDYNTAIEVDPYDADSYVQRGNFYDESYRDYQAALADYNRAIELDPYSARAYSNRAVAYIFLGNSEQAIDDLKRAIELDPTNEHTHFTLAAVYGELGQYDEARDAYTQAIEMGHRYDTSALLYRAQVYAALGDYDKALTDSNDYLATINQTGENQYFILVAHLVRGSVYVYRGEYDLASPEYSAAFAMETEFAANYYAWGGGYRVTPLRETLIFDVQAAIVGDSQNADLYLQLGNLYMEFGRWQEAITTYRQYLSLSPSPALERLVATLENLIG
jgi:tetratricopeptide (TPR) repeat protein